MRQNYVHYTGTVVRCSVYSLVRTVQQWQQQRVDSTRLPVAGYCRYCTVVRYIAISTGTRPILYVCPVRRCSVATYGITTYFTVLPLRITATVVLILRSNTYSRGRGPVSTTVLVQLYSTYYALTGDSDQFQIYLYFLHNSQSLPSVGTYTALISMHFLSIYH